MVSFRLDKTDAQVAEQGIATNISANSVTDIYKTWVPNQWVGSIVRLRGGNNDGAYGVVRSNNANALYFTTPLPSTVEDPVATVYEILGITVAVTAPSTTDALLEELLNVMKQVRNGLSILTEQDLKESDIT